jgi:hypothetical protein
VGQSRTIGVGVCWVRLSVGVGKGTRVLGPPHLSLLEIDSLSRSRCKMSEKQVAVGSSSSSSSSRSNRRSNPTANTSGGASKKQSSGNPASSAVPTIREVDPFDRPLVRNYCCYHRICFKQETQMKKDDEAGKDASASPAECIYFRKNGRCKNGDSCKFVHNAASAPTVSTSDRPERKSSKAQRPAPVNITTGESQESDGSALPVPKSSAICTFFLKNGKCKNGENCRYAHTFSSETSTPSPRSEAKKAEVENPEPSPISAETTSVDTPTSAVKGIKVSSQMTNLLKNFVGMMVHAC